MTSESVGKLIRRLGFAAALALVAAAATTLGNALTKKFLDSKLYHERVAPIIDRWMPPAPTQQPPKQTQHLPETDGSTRNRSDRLMPPAPAQQPPKQAQQSPETNASEPDSPAPPSSPSSHGGTFKQCPIPDNEAWAPSKEGALGPTIWRCHAKRMFAFQCVSHRISLVTDGDNRFTLARFFGPFYWPDFDEQLFSFSDKNGLNYHPLTRAQFWAFQNALSVRLVSRTKVVSLDLADVKRLSSVLLSNCLDPPFPR
jgi:hypothetical protein